MQIIKEVKDLLRDRLVNLWDGTWERKEDHRETFFNLGYWHDLVYKKQFGDYVVYVGCAGELNDFVTFIDVQRKGGSRHAWLETPDDGHGINAVISERGRRRLGQEFIDAASRFVAEVKREES
jgi:hypothetical protein